MLVHFLTLILVKAHKDMDAALQLVYPWIKCLNLSTLENAFWVNVPLVS